MRIYGPEDKYDLNGGTSAALGFFDGVHLGHAAVIAAAEASGRPTVVVTFRRHPSAVLGCGKVGMLTSPEQKEEIFRRLGVEAVAYLEFASVRDMSAADFVREILIGRFHSAAVYCGFNYRFGRGAAAGPEELKEVCAGLGILGESVARVSVGGEAVSSTRIRRLVAEGEVRKAAMLLGRPFSIRFPVVHGRALGRTLGAPTINQIISEEYVYPRFGVYASKTHTEQGSYASVTNVGVKPTVGSDFVSAETYILGFSGDLYGRAVEVELTDFLRPERKFSGLQELKAQIAADAHQARSMVRESGRE